MLLCVRSGLGDLAVRGFAALLGVTKQGPTQKNIVPDLAQPVPLMGLTRVLMLQ